MMIKTIDAKVFFLQPGEKDRERISKLIEMEICEFFILEKPQVVGDLINQLDKSVVILDRETYSHELELNRYVENLIAYCGDRLLKVLSIESSDSLSVHEKVYRVTREEADDEEQIKKIISELNLWGMRNYIRFGSQKTRIAFFRMKFGSHWRTGVIHDISASGMSCSFDRFGDIDVSDKSTTIELCIKDRIFKLKGNFLIRRTFKNSNMFVLVFSRKRGHSHIEHLNSIIFTLTREQILEKIVKLV